MSSPDLALLLAVIACCIGGALGGYALARPEDVLSLVGLKRDPDKPHSLSEVRATYGGLFLMPHAGVAAALGYAPGVGGLMALALSLCWAGAGVARVFSIFRDKADTPFNIRAAVLEFAMAAALALPFWSMVSGDPVGGAVVV